MKISRQEQLAIIVTVIIMLTLPRLLISFGPDSYTEGELRTINLTGVMKTGVWTEDKVTALNYGWKDFKPVTVRLEVGEEVILRLTSADVIHSFYVPELNPKSVTVEPGHFEELRLIAEKPGIYIYYCITVCGDCHYSMQGVIVVGDYSEDEIAAAIKTNKAACRNHEPQSIDMTFLEHGKMLFGTMGCSTCHGSEGQGGINNPNYVKLTVPALNDLADRMWIYWEEDAEIILKLLEDGVDIASIVDEEPIENFGRFQAQYGSMRMKLIEGAPHVQKADSSGPTPPLIMPSWENKLSSHDMDAVLAYLISIFDWSQFD